MKYFYLSISVFILFLPTLFAQNSPIPQSNYTILDYSSDNENHPVAHGFDADIDTWWAIWNDDGFTLPAHVDLDLGTEFDIDGISYRPNADSPSTKAIGYEVHTSTDGTNWDIQKVGNFEWVDNNDVNFKKIGFGTVTRRYIRVIYTSSTDNNNNIHTTELVIWKSNSPGTNQQNQVISFEQLDDMSSTTPDFQLTATSSSGLPITYTVLSGPANVNGDILSLDGSEGTVTIEASQPGDASYYPTSTTQSFEVVDLSLFEPTITTRLSENQPIEMDMLSFYPIYINAYIDPWVDIENVEVSMDGTPQTVIEKEGFYYVNWLPSQFGNYNFSMTAHATNGKSTTITRNVEVTNSYNDKTVTSMQDVVIWFGQENSRWYYGNHSLPQHVGAYDQIIAYMNVECPSGNCDDWDRWAHIDIKGPDGNWIQFIRYITPYGVACQHELDVTDYASLLQGDVEMRMFIDTWGTGGWQITLDFEHRAGTPEYRYSRVEEVWDASYSFGNPAELQPVETVSYEFNGDIQKSVLSLSNTGHGWGQNNSQNAAEFYRAEHYIDIDGQETFVQDLWDQCNPNPDNCTGQLGTWQHNRAGWCPGAIAHPDKFDITSFIGNGNFDIHYRFDPTYTDLCHANNPNCVSGVTCSDCNDGYNPVYYVDAHVINYSNTPLTYDLNTPNEYIDNTLVYDLQILPNPTSGVFNLTVPEINEQIRLNVLAVDGKELKTYYFSNSEKLNQYKFDLTDLESGIYFINMESDAGQGTARLVIQ